MVRKEELCDWFRNLHPCKRVDYMCGLLHICLPLELRFIGSVLEDLAKKDFHYLRDAEIKANQLAEFANLNSMLLTDEKLRSKIIIDLALLNSSNSSCAENIFEIFERQIDNLLTYVHSHHSKKLTDEVHLMLTMAIHHPAFKAYQKTILDDKLKLLEKQNPDFFWCENEPDLNLPSRPFDSEISHNIFPKDNQTLICDKPEKVSIVSIEIVGNKDVPHSKKNEISVKEYHIQSKWSNGEIREVYMKPKALHDLHLKLLNQLPEEKKKRTFIPYYPGKANKDELTKMQTANEYLRKMAKVLSQIPDCEVFTEPFRCGTLVNQPSSIASTSTNVPQQHKPLIFQTSPPCGDHPTQLYDHNHRQNPLRMFNNFPPTQSSPGPSQLSSTTNSPSNSRTSSPVPQNPSAQSRFKMGPIGSVEMVHSIRPSNIELSLNQLLLLLNLEKHFDNLKEFSIKQVIQMSTEDFAKAGLPADAQDRLRKKLDKLKQTLDSNGITESLSRTSFPESPVFQINCLPSGSPMYMTPQYCPIFHPTPAYTSQPIGLLQSPPGHYQPGEISPANTEAMSPPPSPLQVSSLTADQMQVHPIGHVPLAAGSTSLMSPPAAIAAASLGVSDVKILKQPWSQAMDSSGSEEDRGANNKIKSRGRPQQSQSLPQISQSAVTVSASDESKMPAPPNSLSVPHTHPPLINTEQRTDTPPPPIHSLPTAIVNGYASDPSPHQLQGPPPPLRGIYPALRFKSPQPTHTGQKNLIPMPMSFGMHPPQGIGKSSGAVGPMHPPLHPIHSFINTQAGVPSNQVMMLSQTLQSNSLPLGPQSQHPSLSESPNVLYYVPLQTNILTSIANSSAAITTTQSHLTGQPHSHSPAPAANSGAEQVPGASVIVSSELVDSSRSDGSCLTPPSHTPPHHNILKSQSNASGPDSGTPSPPLAPSSNKQPGLYYYVVPHQQNNGYVSHMPPLYHHLQQNPQPPPQPLPNGVAPDMYWPGHRFPSQMTHGMWPPFLYGNSVYPPYNPPVNPTVTTNSSSLQNSTSNQAPPSVVASTKSLCYNCGHVGHKASHCEENTMENMSNTFRLNIKPPDYKPKSDSE